MRTRQVSEESSMNRYTALEKQVSHKELGGRQTVLTEPEAGVAKKRKPEQVLPRMPRKG